MNDEINQRGIGSRGNTHDRNGHCLDDRSKPPQGGHQELNTASVPFDYGRSATKQQATVHGEQKRSVMDGRDIEPERSYRASVVCCILSVSPQNVQCEMKS